MKIIIEKEISEKLREYIHQAEGEISGLGRSSYDKERGVIVVNGVWIWEQECSMATTEVIDHESVFSLTEELVEQGIPMEELNVWWHSHADMEAFFSNTDVETIENWVNDRYLLAIVGNKKGAYKARVEIKEPISCYLGEEVCEVSHAYGSDELVQQVSEEIEQKVKKRTWRKRYRKKGKTTGGGKQERLWGEYQTRLESSAEMCGCSTCLEYLSGDRALFEYEGHDYQVSLEAWIRSEQEMYV